MNHKIVVLGREYLPQIREIINEAIANTTAVWDEQPRSEQRMEQWFDFRIEKHCPILGIVEGGKAGEAGRLQGFATWGPFRNFEGYQFTVEHSVYVHHDFRGRGLGRELLRRLVELAEAGDVHVMVAGIDAENTQSVNLHRKLGFEFCGRIRQAGRKFNRWLDLEFYQRMVG